MPFPIFVYMGRSRFLLYSIPAPSTLSAVNMDQFIGSASKADRLRMFQCVQTVSGLNPLYKRIAVLRAVDQINTCLIQRHRVVRGENADIMHIRRCRTSITVTVH